MLLKTFSAALAVGAMVSGCAFQSPTADQFSYVQPPRYYEGFIKTYFAPKLKDPESARYTFGEPAKAYTNNGSLRGGEVTWRGYAVPVSINAKNSYGGYTGNKEYIVLFNGDNPFEDTTENHPLFHWWR